MTPLKYTRQQLADALQAWVAMNQFGHWVICEGPFNTESNGLWNEQATSNMWLIPSWLEITDPPTNWRDSLTPPSTEADPEVCEWRPRGSAMFRVECESRRRDAEHLVMYPGPISRCPYCSRPIRFVEDSDDA